MNTKGKTGVYWQPPEDQEYQSDSEGMAAVPELVFVRASLSEEPKRECGLFRSRARETGLLKVEVSCGICGWASIAVSLVDQL